MTDEIETVPPPEPEPEPEPEPTPDKPKRERVTGRMILDKLDEIGSKIGTAAESATDDSGLTEVVFEPEPPAPAPEPEKQSTPAAPATQERRGGFPRRGR